MLRIGIACNPMSLSPTALRRAIPRRYPFLGWSCIDLFEYGIVDVRTKRTFNGSQIWLVAVRRELHPMGQT